MKQYLVPPKRKFRLSQWSPADSGDYKNNDEGQAKAEDFTKKILSKLDDLQELLYADGKKALLIILQGMDTAGKDGTIKHVMSGVNPQGCRVSSFKVPTALELSHDFLWRVHQQVPPKGYVGIFNRSHYEDVLAPRVHGLIKKKTWEQRYKAINEFEKLLVKSSVTILKFFLHISKEEQRERLESRVKNPKKHWKLSLNDIKERKFWPTYQRAYQDAIAATSTEHAPWYVVPANHKWFRNLVVGKVVVETLEAMDLHYPKAEPGINFKTLRIR